MADGLRVRRAGRRFETPHGPGYTLLIERDLPNNLVSYSAEGYAVQSPDGAWFTYDQTGELVVSRAYLDGNKLWCVLLEHAQILKGRERQ